jgi:hemerythrin-like domain-containing protein
MGIRPLAIDAGPAPGPVLSAFALRQGVAVKPRGPLMIEHRLIERMIEVVRQQAGIAQEQRKGDALFVDTVVDFIRTSADRTHHGKEEDILFRELAAKPLSAEDEQLMQQLLDEHRFARRTVSELAQAKQEYLRGQTEALDTVLAKLRVLVGFYPEHIRKEDRVFFPNSEKYSSEEEQQAMLGEFWEFDRKMIHEKYTAVVEHLEGLR